MTQKKAKHEEAHEEAELIAKTAEQPAAFPYTFSINEPQTVSLPLPANVDVPVPTIASLQPADCAIGDPDFTLYVSGENFFADSVIVFATQSEPTTLEADGTLSTIVKPSLWAEPVTVQVVVKNGPEASEPVDFDFKPVARSGRK